MINWRSIKEDGYPTDDIKYIVTDGTDISTTRIYVVISFDTDDNKGIKKFRKWTGDDNTYEDNQCCSGSPCFDMIPTHWCPANELNLPKQ